MAQTSASGFPLPASARPRAARFFRKRTAEPAARSSPRACAAAARRFVADRECIVLYRRLTIVGVMPAASSSPARPSSSRHTAALIRARFTPVELPARACVQHIFIDGF